MRREPAQGSTPDLASRPVPRSAGWLRRGLATTVDMVVFLALSAPLLYPVAAEIPVPADLSSLPELTGTLTDPVWSDHASGVLGVWVALWWAYFILGWGLLGATPGKWVMRLRVVDHRGLRPIGAARATLRLLAYMVSSAFCAAGHLLMLVRRDRCALHDLLAGTRVVCVTRAGAPISPGQAWPRSPAPEPTTPTVDDPAGDEEAAPAAAEPPTPP